MCRRALLSGLVPPAGLIGCSAGGSTTGAPGEAGSMPDAGGRETRVPQSVDEGGDASEVTPDATANEGRADASRTEVVLPLSTCDRWIVDRIGRRVKLAGVNWYGA